MPIQLYKYYYPPNFNFISRFNFLIYYVFKFVFDYNIRDDRLLYWLLFQRWKSISIPYGIGLGNGFDIEHCPEFNIYLLAV